MFRVSTQAIRIRLENLGLLRIDHLVEQDLFGRVSRLEMFLRKVFSV